MLSIEFTNFDKVSAGLHKAPDEMKKEVGNAIGKSMEMVATESKRLTPLKTGYLRSSIGSDANPDGIFKQKGFTGYVGTNVKYAWRQHEELKWHHSDGEAKYMEKGAKNALPYVEKTMQKAIENVIKSI